MLNLLVQDFIRLLCCIELEGVVGRWVRNPEARTLQTSESGNLPVTLVLSQSVSLMGAVREWADAPADYPCRPARSTLYPRHGSPEVYAPAFSASDVRWNDDSIAISSHLFRRLLLGL